MRTHQDTFRRFLGKESDACALYAAVSKRPPKNQSPVLWDSALEALMHMEHRAGMVDGRSDGTGLLTDIPRRVWGERLEAGHCSVDAGDPRFWLLTLATSVSQRRANLHELENLMTACQFRRLTSHWDVIDGLEGLLSHAFYYEGDFKEVDEDYLLALSGLERLFPGQLAAFSRNYTIFKMRNGAQALRKAAEMAWDEDFRPRVVVGHNRFSTNTTTELRRVQPFLGLAHNGEINTIDRLTRDMEDLGIDVVVDGSDSQNLDRLLSVLVTRYSLSPAEAVRLAVAPSPAHLETMPALWRNAQAFWGPVVQGPAGIVYLSEGYLVGAVDALGLRPLWLMETAADYVLTSEPGVIDGVEWMSEPRALGPGEVVAITWTESGEARLEDPREIERSLLQRFSEVEPVKTLLLASETELVPQVPTWRMAADGWRKDDRQVIQAWKDGHEPIGSLGFDGPLGCLAAEMPTIADYLQETVAVVTNPALDREREKEHFRLANWLGARPDWNDKSQRGPLWECSHPWLRDQDVENFIEQAPERIQRVPLNWPLGADEVETARDLARAVLTLSQSGVTVVVLDDEKSYRQGQSVSLDPVLAVAAIDNMLRSKGCRRHVSLIVRSGAIRHLHDAAVLLGLGANALVPYAIWSQIDPEQQPAVVSVMNQGLEKILSTMGTHELTGYGRAFSAIGLPDVLAELLGIVSYAAVSYSVWKERRLEIQNTRHAMISETSALRFIPRATTHIYKAAIRMAEGESSAQEFHHSVRGVEIKHPTQLRHTLSFRHELHPSKNEISLAVGDHALPFIISSMSFGSQGEKAFRAYADAAKNLNMLAMNGEGGEIPDMVGRYYPWRGYQIASGRFGINAQLINGAQYVEIKIGQGAKPGEGGHLPGKKVSTKVADARRAQFGVDLISPSNNHDLYSIEDLKQLIDELKQVNPDVRVAVKVPIVPNIGTIAVGIVKAGADVINLSGFDGGTGAARLHALRHVGLPIDVGVPVTHAALTVAGLRSSVEIWADGGMRSADDVLKMLILGADRVGFGTMAMVALGCTICRQCQKDTCHVGITTQMESVEEALSRGVKHFRVQDEEKAVRQLVQFFRGLGEQLQEGFKSLGLTSVREAQGQWHLLRQTAHQESLDYQSFLDILTAGLYDMAQNSASMMRTGSGEAVEAPFPMTHWANAPQYADRGASGDRTMGTELSGRRVRDGSSDPVRAIQVPRVAGQGFGAFLHDNIALMARGGAQDGMAKSAQGGYLAVVKTRGVNGRYYGGHVGKSLAYGAQGGTFVVQGGADARAGIRLAGGNLIIMGDGLPSPVEAQNHWDSAAIKGFGFEYMTRGCGMVLADPGPWLASGMTGGILYLRKDDARGLTPEFLRSRLASAAKVQLEPLAETDVSMVKALLEISFSALRDSDQGHRIGDWSDSYQAPRSHFLKLVPQGQQADPTVSTE